MEVFHCLKSAIPFALAACWLGVILRLSSQNGAQTAGLSLGITDVLLGLLERLGIVLNPTRFRLWLRTLAHVAVFWLEGVLLWWSFRR